MKITFEKISIISEDAKVNTYHIPVNPKLKNGYTWQDICDIVEKIHPLFTNENMYLTTAISTYIGFEDDFLQKQAKKTAASIFS